MTLGVGKLEGRIIVPSGGFALSLTDGTGGPYSVTFTAAESYYMSSADGAGSSLLAALKTKLQAAGGGGRTYTCSMDSLTGIVTISVNTGTFSITWTTPSLRNLLGFDANISAQSSASGADHAESVWLPNVHAMPDYGLNSAGRVISNAMVRIAPDGTYSAFHGPSRKANRLYWPIVQVHKVIEAEETSTNESYERWWLDTVRGEGSWAQSGRLRWYPNASSDATYASYCVTEAVSPQCERVDANYDGLWSVSLSVSEVA
jgi:hypothetical protein